MEERSARGEVGAACRRRRGVLSPRWAEDMGKIKCRSWRAGKSRVRLNTDQARYSKATGGRGAPSPSACWLGIQRLADEGHFDGASQAVTSGPGASESRARSQFPTLLGGSTGQTSNRLGSLTVGKNSAFPARIGISGRKELRVVPAFRCVSPCWKELFSRCMTFRPRIDSRQHAVSSPYEVIGSPAGDRRCDPARRFA